MNVHRITLPQPVEFIHPSHPHVGLAQDRDNLAFVLLGSPDTVVNAKTGHTRSGCDSQSTPHPS